MANTEVLFYVFVTFIWNFKVIIAVLCGSGNVKSCCLGFHWDETQTSCIPCKVGYFGTNCDEKCIYPTYGEECHLICSCSEKDCWHVGGCINSTAKIVGNICAGQTGDIICCYGYKWNNKEKKCKPCEKGYTGQNCEVVCSLPTYGLNCQSICNCSETKCDPVDGCKGHSTKFASCHLYLYVTTYVEDSFRIASGVDDGNANYKQSNSTPTKKNRSDGLMHATIGLAIVAILIIVLFFYAHLLKKYQNRNAMV